MSTLKKYSSYKESGTAWLGNIPEHWESLPSKRYHRVDKSINNNKSCDNVLSLTLRGVVNNNPDSPEGMIPKDYGTYQVFEQDDLVFKLIDLENVKTSRVGLVHEKGIMSSAYIRLKIGNNVVPKFAYYYYYSLYLNQVFNNLGSGVRSTLGPTDLLEIQFVYPPEKEQTKIASFLDEKIAQIDNAIKQKEELIKILKERREIIIHKAVTQGLDSEVELKRSKFRWLEKIPKHWELKALKHVLRERNERSETGEETLFMMSQVHGLVVRSDYHDKAVVAQSSVGNKKVYKDDLVFNKLKAHLGVFAKSNIDNIGIVSPDYAVYYGKGEIIDLKYLELLFKNPIYISHFISKATGIVEGLIRLYTDDLFSLKVPIPPENEQKNILEYVNGVSLKIDKAISLEKEQIDKLKEYKSTLIDSCVTGKVKVPTV